LYLPEANNFSISTSSSNAISGNSSDKENHPNSSILRTGKKAQKIEGRNISKVGNSGYNSAIN
jgi:hypothetical protein